MHEALRLDIEEVNVALNKPTTDSDNSDAPLIVDGSTSTGYYATTHASANEWVQIDLEAVTTIDSVRVYFRPGAECNRNCQNHAAGASIVISDTPDFSAGTQCGDELAWASSYRTNTCDGISGRYVTARGSSSTRPLQIVELEVLAKAILTPDGYVYAPLIYDFVGDSASDELVCWDILGEKIIIKNEGRFVDQIMKVYFKMEQFSSFKR